MTLAIVTSRPGAYCDQTPALAVRVAQGERGAFDELVRLFQTRVTRLAHRLLGWNGDVEDVVQDVFLTALHKAASFKGNCTLWTWLMVITVNRCRTYQRQQKVIGRVMRFLGGKKHEPSGSADTSALADESVAEVRTAVAGLRPIHREVIVLFYLEQMSVSDIGQLLGASTGTVEVRLHRARAELRGLLKGPNAG